jgi:hypothetical protein
VEGEHGVHGGREASIAPGTGGSPPPGAATGPRARALRPLRPVRTGFHPNHESIVTDSQREPPFEGGSQPVPEHPPEVPGPGRSVMQIVVLVIALIVIVGSVVFYFR